MSSQAKRQLTDNLAKRDLATGSRYTIWDKQQSGFGLRIGASGKVAWIAKYRVGKGRGGEQRLITLGSPPGRTCDDARTLTGQLVLAGRQNIDLYAQWQAEEEERKREYLARDLAFHGVPDASDPAFLKTAWHTVIALRPNNSHRYKRNTERVWKHIADVHGDDIKTKDVTREMILSIKAAMSDRPQEFNNFRAMLFSVLENEAYENRIDRNVIAKGVPPYPLQYRDTILSERGVLEFKKFFSDFSRFPENRHNHARFLLCLLLTGQRPKMLRSLERKDDGECNYVDFKNKMMVFRTHKTSKDSSNKSDSIPLSAHALALMQAASEVNPDARYVFCSHDFRKGFCDLPISETRVSDLFREHRHRFDKEGSEELVVYSLRHTFGSVMVNSGKVSIAQVSKLMLHNNITTTQRYIKTTQMSRKSAADQIDSII